MVNTMSGALTIVVADDHPLFRQALSVILRQRFQNLNLLEANDVNELKTLLTSDSPDLILLDLNIPYANGFEALIELKQNHPQNTCCVNFWARGSINGS